MRIDIHSHVVPSCLFGRRDADERWPRLVATPNGADVIVEGALFRRITEECWSMPARLAAMDRAGVSGQVISPMPELLSYWADVDAAVDNLTELNEWVGEFVAKGHDRFRGLGVVALQSPDAAIDMLEHIKEIGLSGIEIGSNVNGICAADERFTPVLAAATQLGLAVFAHAHRPRYDLPGARQAQANAVALPLEIGHFALSAVATGLPTRVPGLRMAVSHGGGSLAALLPRLDRAHPSGEPDRPTELARQLYYDTVVFGRAPQQLLVATVGRERIAWGSDYPFVPYEDSLLDATGQFCDDAARTFLDDATFAREVSEVMTP